MFRRSEDAIIFAILVIYTLMLFSGFINNAKTFYPFISWL
jgi:hypothetical protein